MQMRLYTQIPVQSARSAAGFVARSLSPHDPSQLHDLLAEVRAPQHRGQITRHVVEDDIVGRGKGRDLAHTDLEHEPLRPVGLGALPRDPAVA